MVAAASAEPPVTQPVKHHSGSEEKIDAQAHRLSKAIAGDIERVEPYLERYGYWAVFAAVGVEGIGIPAPGQTLLEAGALVAAVPDSKLNISLLLFVTILATSLGQTIGYLIGRSGGRAVLNRLPIPADSLEKIERGFNRYGGWLVFFGHFVDGPRQLIGLFSGVLQMHWGRFMLLNIGGAVVWASFWALGVYYLDLRFRCRGHGLTEDQPLDRWAHGDRCHRPAALCADRRCATAESDQIVTRQDPHARQRRINLECRREPRFAGPGIAISKECSMLSVLRSALVAALYLTAGAAGAGTTLTAPEALDKAEAGEITLIDIRTPPEWRQTGVAAGALTIDMTKKTFVQEVLRRGAGRSRRTDRAHLPHRQPHRLYAARRWRNWVSPTSPTSRRGWRVVPRAGVGAPGLPVEPCTSC